MHPLAPRVATMHTYVHVQYAYWAITHHISVHCMLQLHWPLSQPEPGWGTACGSHRQTQADWPLYNLERAISASRIFTGCFEGSHHAPRSARVRRCGT